MREFFNLDQISPSYCKCGQQRIFQTLSVKKHHSEMGYSCPKRKWWNFFNHDQDTVHAWIPKGNN